MVNTKSIDRWGGIFISKLSPFTSSFTTPVLPAALSRKFSHLSLLIFLLVRGGVKKVVVLCGAHHKVPYTPSLIVTPNVMLKTTKALL